MAKPLTIALPLGVQLWDGCVIRVTALDPATGNTVSGVDVSNVTLQVVQTAGDPNALQQLGWLLVPGPGA